MDEKSDVSFKIVNPELAGLTIDYGQLRQLHMHEAGQLTFVPNMVPTPGYLYGKSLVA